MRYFASQHAWMMLAVAGLVTLVAHSAHAQIQWQSQLKTAHAQAQAEGKLLLLHFYDDNCVWCDRLEQGAFQSSEVAAAIHSNYVPVKIHAGKNPSIAATFKVTKFPTDVIVTTGGQSLLQQVSPQEPGRYVAMLAQSAQSGRAMLAQSTPAPTTASASPTAVQSPAGTPAQAVSSRTAPVSTGPPASGSPNMELAMEGYCAVTVVEKDLWVEGNPEFSVVHLGKLYLFADKGAMERFLASPDPYTPVLNGIDVVRFFEEHKIVQGNREFGLKDPDHNRMFFFADEAALNHFYNVHTRYTEAALAVMQKAVKDANP